MGRIKSGFNPIYDEQEIIKDPCIPDRHLLYDKELGEYAFVTTGYIDINEITQSHKGECGVQAVLTRLAMGDTSMFRPADSNLGDISGMPDNIHDLRQLAASGTAAVQVLSDLGLTAEDGTPLDGYAIAGLEQDQLLKVLSRKIASLENKEAPNDAR